MCEDRTRDVKLKSRTVRPSEDRTRDVKLNSRTVRPSEDRTRDVKPPIVPSSELGVSSGPEEEDGWRKESEDGADVECL